jgi:hypothetical protein
MTLVCQRAGLTWAWVSRCQDHDIAFEVVERVQDFGGAKEEPLVASQKYPVRQQPRRIRTERWRLSNSPGRR